MWCAVDASDYDNSLAMEKVRFALLAARALFTMCLGLLRKQVSSSVCLRETKRAIQFFISICYAFLMCRLAPREWKSTLMSYLALSIF
jgi:hypothetical protein